MSNNLNIEGEAESYKKNYSPFRDLNYQAILKDEDFDPSSKYSLLFFHACWSGPSIVHIRRIINAIESQNISSLPLFIADIDHVSHDFQTLYLGGLSHGWGEAAWIENGHVKIKHLYSPDVVPFIDYVVERLK